jgi:hypothetical protein
MRITFLPRRCGSHLLRLISSLLVLLALLPAAAQAPQDNGIHVGEPKIYDSRSLTLMLDSLSQSLRNTNFIDPKALASALGNLQGFSNQDFSQAFQANGAVGPQAASVFSGTGGAGPTPVGGTTPPNVSITVAPVLNSGSAATTPVAPAPAATLGPQPPALPTLQTAPAFTPNFGPNATDLLSDEVNLTYQIENISMLLERSLSDRLFRGQARLQAVMGFDIDIEPTVEAKDAVAVVDVNVTLGDCGGLPDCDESRPMSLVAMMPEEGSYNAATLSQKASAFGGAVASSVFSVGYAAQKRSQVFYLYRDMDTVSFQKSDSTSHHVDFGWQFRPVLGRRSVSPGMRHMMAVLALPANDLPGNQGKTPVLKVTVNTSWIRYDGATQATGAKPSFWARIFGSDKLPESGTPQVFNDVLVPTTPTTQHDLGPTISKVKWVQGDASSGVAIVTGKNFFPNTTVRFGARTYSTPSDGLVIKSDQQLEVALPLTAAVTEGVLSGRYGKAVTLQAPDPSLPAGFNIRHLEFSATGNDMYQVDATLHFYGEALPDQQVQISDLQTKANRPVVSINGVPLSTPSFLDQNSDSEIIVTTFVSSSVVKAGPATITVTFPFAGPRWSASLPHYDASLKIVRLGGKDSTRLLISATDATMLLCGYRPPRADSSHRPQTWVMQLDGNRSFVVLADTAPEPLDGALKCADHRTEMLSLDMRTADLKQYHRFALLNNEGVFPPIVGEIPPQDPPPPGPSVDKDQKISVSQYDVKTVAYKGKNLNQVTKVLFDKTGLDFKPSDDGKTIVISLAAAVTAKPRSVELQLISDGNDPVLAPLTVTAAPTPKAGK